MKLPPEIAWPLFVVLLLTLGVLTTLASLVASRSDGGVQVVEDYYQKAVDWDKTHDAQAASDALGWSAALSLTPAGEGFRLGWEIRDRAGQPVEDLSGTVQGFRPERAGARFEAPLEAIAPGAYVAHVPALEAGLWDFDLSARQGAHWFHTTMRREVGSAPHPAVH